MKVKEEELEKRLNDQGNKTKFNALTREEERLRIHKNRIYNPQYIVLGQILQRKKNAVKRMPDADEQNVFVPILKLTWAISKANFIRTKMSGSV